MRKAVKIKTTVFLLAWVMMFSHNIIPHNHLQEECAGFPCAGNAFNSSSGNHSDSTSEFRTIPVTGNVCNASNILFNNFNPDNLIFSGLTDFKVGVLPETDPAIINTEPLFLYNYYNGSSSLRSPPEI